MKLYTFDPAPNPQRLKMFIDYKGVAITTSHDNYAAPNADPMTPLDPWRLPYLYTTNGKEFTIWSTGADKVNSNGAGDDISIDAVDKQAILDKRPKKESNQ